MPGRTTRTSRAPGLAVIPLPVRPRATAETALQVAPLANGRRPVRLGRGPNRLNPGLQLPAPDAEVMGETQLESLFGPAPDTF